MLLEKICIPRIQPGKNSSQDRIASSSITSYNEAIEVLSIEVGRVQCIIWILCTTDQPFHEMINEKNFQRLYSQCT